MSAPPPVQVIREELVERFCLEYVKDFIGAKAARRAGIEHPKSARTWASRTLARPEVAARVKELTQQHYQRLDMEVSDLVDRLVRIATTDVRELVEFRRCNCRHCWGKNHRYQHTDGALSAARMRHQQMLKKARADGRDLTDVLPEAFDEEGGGGYDASADPNPECPECAGEGVGMPFLKDTRDLGPNAAAAFAGLKVTKGGVEVKVHDPVKAIELLGRHKGAWTDNLNVKGHLTVANLAGRMRNRGPLA